MSRDNCCEPVSRPLPCGHVDRPRRFIPCVDVAVGQTTSYNSLLFCRECFDQENKWREYAYSHNLVRAGSFPVSDWEKAPQSVLSSTQMENYKKLSQQAKVCAECLHSGDTERLGYEEADLINTLRRLGFDKYFKD